MRGERGLLMAGILVIALSGCVSMTSRATGDHPSGAKIAKGNAQVNLPHYSIVVPPDRGWFLRKGDERVEGVLVEQRYGPPLPMTLLMQFMRIDVLDERLRSSSAQQVADDYRNLEQRIMIDQGVDKGRYRLGELAMGDELVGEKRFYTMRYTASSSTHNQTAALYLYFPREEKHSYFILAHYSETLPRGAAIAFALREDFLQVLKSLRVVQ